MNLVAVTISRHEETWHVLDMPWFNFVKNEDVPMLEEGGISGLNAKEYQKDWSRNNQGPRRYITYLASKRNMAVKLALERYPDATDVLMCDTYYLKQLDGLKSLISDYGVLERQGFAVALGGAVWGKIRTRIKDFLYIKPEWYDKWGVPDLAFTPYGWTPEKDRVLGNLLNPPIPGLFHTSSLPGVAIWPREIWDKGARYGVFDDLHGCEHNYFYESARIPRYVDFNAKFWRELQYPFLKSLRCSLHLGRFIGKKPQRTLPDHFSVKGMDSTGKFKK